MVLMFNLGFVLFSVSQTSCTADTTADTSHAFDKVTVKDSFVQLEQSHTAGFNTVAGNCFQIKIKILFLKSLCNSIGKTAGASKDTPEVGGVVENVLAKCCNVNILARQRRLKLSLMR